MLPRMFDARYMKRDIIKSMWSEGAKTYRRAEEIAKFLGLSATNNADENESGSKHKK